MLNEKNKRRYGPNFYNQELRKLKWNLQKGRDMLTGIKLVKGNSHYHHIDYDRFNDNPDNYCWLTAKMHMKITANQWSNPTIGINAMLLLSNNLDILKMGKIPQSWKIINQSLYHKILERFS